MFASNWNHKTTHDVICKNSEPLYIQMAPFNIVMQKEGWRVSQLKGKYATWLSMLIQEIWLKGTHERINKKFMF
jgi:hypothetical protein